MIERQLWVDYKFNLGIDIFWTQNVMNRIPDTTMRIESHCKSMNDDQLSKKLKNAWSIKENICHLTDLEILWIDRFHEFRLGKKELIIADMSNQKTKAFNHNSQKLETLLSNFIPAQKELMSVYSSLDKEA